MQEMESLGDLTQEDTLMQHQEVTRGAVEDVLSMWEFTRNLGPSSSMEEEDLMDNLSLQSKDSEMEEENLGWQTSRPKKIRKIKKKQVIGATRTSSRIPRDGIPILAKATERAKARDNTQGTISSNPFTVLNSILISIIKSVMSDLDLENSDIEEQIGAFRAEEIARTAIAEANYKAYLEKQKKNYEPQNEEEMGEFAMETISNQDRQIDSCSSKGKEDKVDSVLDKIQSNIQDTMKIMFWNARGQGKAYRRSLVRGHVLQEDLDFAALQETIKQDFCDWELKEMASNRDFQWIWSAAKGHSGGDDHWHQS